MSTHQYLLPQAMERLMKKAQNHLHPQPALLPPHVNHALQENKEKSYKNWLRVQASDRWRRELMLFKLSDPLRSQEDSRHMYNTTPKTSNESTCTNRPLF